MGRIWWRRLAGAILVIDGVGAAIWSAAIQGPGAWTTTLPFIGPALVFPFLLAGLPLLSGLGILRGAGWARVLGMMLVAAYLWIDAWSLATGSNAAVVLDVATSALVAFALVRRWLPRSGGLTSVPIGRVE